MNHLIRSTIAVLSLACGAAQAEPAYSVVDLGTLGGSYSVARGINNSGQLVGEAQRADGIHEAFLYSQGAMTGLGLFGTGGATGAYGVNDSGTVVGDGAAGAGVKRAVVFGAAGPKDLGSLRNSSVARAISNSGQIVGWSDTSTPGRLHAVSHDGLTMTDLGSLPGSASSQGFGINNAGQVVGSTGTEFRHAFLFDVIPDGGVSSRTDLGTLGGATSFALGLNDAGQVVGYSATPAGRTHAFLSSVDWAGARSMVDLGTLPDPWFNLSSRAQDINNAGQVVGFSSGGDDQRGFFYTVDTGLRDLTSLIDPASGWVIYDALAINDSGQIAAWGFNQAFGEHALMLNPLLTPQPPVPEPAHWALLLCGLAVVLLRLRVHPGLPLRTS